MGTKDEKEGEDQVEKGANNHLSHKRTHNADVGVVLGVTGNVQDAGNDDPEELDIANDLHGPPQWDAEHRTYNRRSVTHADSLVASLALSATPYFGAVSRS